MTGISNDGCQKLIGAKTVQTNLTQQEYKNECNKTTIFEVSKDDRLAAKTIVDANGRVQERSIKKTDYYPDGKVKEVNHHDADGNFEYKETHKYDEDGKHRIMYYNKDNKQTGIRLFDENGSTIYEEHVYDDGSWRKTIYDKENNLTKTVEYDENGSMTQETLYDGEYGPITKAVEYDENGSKTKEFFYKDGSMTKVVEYDENGSKTNETLYKDGPKTTKDSSKKTLYRDGSMIQIPYSKDGSMIQTPYRLNDTDSL